MEQATPYYDATKVVALDTKVTALDKDIRQIDARITGLETKFDNVANALAIEFRSSVAGLSKQIAERGTTSWGVIFAGCAVAATVIGMIGGLAISPLTSGLVEIRANIQRIEARQFQELQSEIDNLTVENRNLRHLTLLAPPVKHNEP